MPQINFETGNLLFRVGYSFSRLEPYNVPIIETARVLLIDGKTPTASQAGQCARLAMEFMARLDAPGDGLADQLESVILNAGLRR